MEWGRSLVQEFRIGASYGLELGRWWFARSGRPGGFQAFCAVVLVLAVGRWGVVLASLAVTIDLASLFAGQFVARPRRNTVVVGAGLVEGVDCVYWVILQAALAGEIW